MDNIVKFTPKKKSPIEELEICSLQVCEEEDGELSSYLEIYVDRPPLEIFIMLMSVATQYGVDHGIIDEEEEDGDQQEV